MAKVLTWKRDGNAIDYRFGAVLIARCPVVIGHKHEHMVAVITRLRHYPGVDPGYKEAREIWDNRTEEA